MGTYPVEFSALEAEIERLEKDNQVLREAFEDFLHEKINHRGTTRREHIMMNDGDLWDALNRPIKR